MEKLPKLWLAVIFPVGFILFGTGVWILQYNLLVGLILAIIGGIALAIASVSLWQS